MKRLKGSPGASSALILGILVFLSILFLSCILLIESALSGIRRYDRSHKNRIALITAAEYIVEELCNDTSPSADSPHDGVWEIITQYDGNELSYALEDVSSRIGLNWVRKEFLQTMALLNNDVLPEDIQQFREDTGFHLNLNQVFLNFISKENIDELCTPYSYFNINISDEFVLRKLHLLRIQDRQKAEDFHAKIQELRVERQLIAAQDMKELLGDEDYDALHPILIAEPVINIHFVPPAILKALFLHYDISVEKADQLLRLRSETEILPEQLESAIGPQYSESSLGHYIGVRTWFWKITVTRGQISLQWIVARIPMDYGNGEIDQNVKPVIRLIEEDIFL